MPDRQVTIIGPDVIRTTTLRAGSSRNTIIAPEDRNVTTVDQVSNTTTILPTPPTKTTTIGKQGPAGQPGSTVYLTYPADGPIGGNRVVRLSAGKVTYADHLSLSDANLIIGLTRGAAADGASVQIQSNDVMDEVSWNWTPDEPVFCGVNGIPVQPAPTVGFILTVGIAISPTSMLIGPKMPIILQD